MENSAKSGFKFGCFLVIGIAVGILLLTIVVSLLFIGRNAVEETNRNINEPVPVEAPEK